MLRLGCDCHCALLLLLRLLLPPFLKLGGKQKALFKDSGLRTFPMLLIASAQSLLLLVNQSAAYPPPPPSPRRRLHSRSTVDRSTTMLLLYYTSSNTQWRLFNKIGDRIKSFGFASAEFPLFGGLKTFLILEKRPLQLNNLSHD